MSALLANAQVILHQLSDGLAYSVRDVVRATGIGKPTVVRLLLDMNRLRLVVEQNDWWSITSFGLWYVTQR